MEGEGGRAGGRETREGGMEEGGRDEGEREGRREVGRPVLSSNGPVDGFA